MATSSSSSARPDPEYWAYRVGLWDQWYAVQEAAKAPANAQTAEEIVLTMPDGKEIKGKAGITTGAEVARELKIQQHALAVQFDGKVRDLSSPFEKSGPVAFLRFSDPEGKKVFWHSSAHILGEALEKHFAGLLCVGPALEEGFYYDIALPLAAQSAAGPSDGGVAPKWGTISEENWKDIKALVTRVVKDKQPFQRLVLTKEQALEMFRYNKYKTELISKKVPDGEVCTAYRCGPLIDLCKGPHLPHTGLLGGFSIVKNSSCNWLGDVRNDPLQRVFGISFPDKKMLTAWEEQQKLLAERDHRRLGAEQELFMISPLSPGSCFFLPHGTRIVNRLHDFIRAEYRKRGFQEVITPTMYHNHLFSISGHLQNYAEDMFQMEVDKQPFSLKPMNCPAHCLIFKNRTRSHRELPLRIADFGALHRNEKSGALTGLTRVRRFCQDDAHIFCASNQVESEIKGALSFMDRVYGIFGFQFHLALSTRPEKFLGEIPAWDLAESNLKAALDDFAHPWTLNEGDGAFYGPKIDIRISDALGRKHQCATVQLDFQLPKQFELEFMSHEHALERPVMVHRAIYGSFERFIAILIEHTGGKWPFWVSPRQIMIVPVGPHVYDYAQEAHALLQEAGYYVDCDLSGNTLNKKIRDAQIAQYNFILVLGTEEQKNRSVNIRTRSNEIVGEKSISEALDYFQQLVAAFQ